jgi:tryptophan halogenase
LSTSVYKNKEDSMNDSRIGKVVVVGGGTAGWMTASALANRFRHSITKVALIESADIGTIGVGEATVPYIKEFLKELNINEVDFMQKTQATYKLGIDFDGWYQPDKKFFHPFAGYGSRIAKIPFHHYWTKLQQHNKVNSLESYCLAAQMARFNKFALPKANNDIEISTFNYAFHFDATLFSKYLRNYAERLHIKRYEATVEEVHQDSHSGFINSLRLSTGQVVEGDLFIDCTGFAGLLIEKTLNTGYESWKQYLPCDNAVALPCDIGREPDVFTRSLAMPAGWQWRIPLQHRIGNGYVYCSDYLDSNQAIDQLINNIEAKYNHEPRVIPFHTGMRKKAWNKNVFAIGLSSGFMEPLESTSIYLIQSSINVLLNSFPNKHFNAGLIQAVNTNLRSRQERLRDFLILHYYYNDRQGEPFWDMCRHMKIPDSLSEKIEHFNATCQPKVDELDFFTTNSWLAMFAGFNKLPDYYHPGADDFSVAALEEEFVTLEKNILSTVSKLPTHRSFIEHNIRATGNSAIRQPG